jgi:hypothetical protein
MAGRFLDLLGTSYTKIQLGIAGLVLKNVSSKIRARNAADNADAPLVGSVISASGDVIELNEDAAGSGADWKYSLQRPASGMTAAQTLTLPAGNGSPGQVPATDGSGNLSWTTVAAGNDKLVTDTTTLGFGSASPLAMFNLPANAVVESVQVIIDTAFNGAPTLSVGIAGTTAKYLAATQVDLTAAAGTSFEVAPGLAAVGAIENLIATYAAGGASAGSARILVHYSIPS